MANMQPLTPTNDGRGKAVGNFTPNCSPASKWAAVVNDRLVWLPDRLFHAAVLREQSGLPVGHALFRDHNSEDDPLVPSEGKIDAVDGNVFYSEAEGEEPKAACSAPAKLAYVVNDRWEIVTLRDQTGRTLRDLFDLSEDAELFRDLRSPEDQPVGDEAPAIFDAGCVFRTQERKHTLRIFVNRLPFTERDGVKPEMTGLEIAKLVEDKPENTRVTRITDGQNTPIALDQCFKIAECDQFKVVRNNVNAGFQSDRIERELAILRESGTRVTLIGGPVPAVIYHDVPVRTGQPVAATDVLVKIPGGYPGGVPDNAFLPAGSPLLNCTPGAAQESLTFGGCQWTQKSIHPHSNSGITWNKDKHGFHTYYGEILNWLHQ